MKIILGIETSCDETAAAVVSQTQDRIIILSNVISSSALLQSKYGGVIPEQAAREQLKLIIPVIEESLRQAGKSPAEIDAIAITQGPGLIGSLLVGVETAKVLSLTWNKPLIPINHLLGHFYATQLKFPSIGLLVSGGHSDIVYFKNHFDFEYLGGTRDDAAGECFDKCARLLGLDYPGGPKLAELALTGNPSSFKLPRPMIDSDNFDFSFSGLKTAVLNIVQSPQFKPGSRADLCASLEEAITDTLVKKTIKAAKLKGVDQITVAGGVAANKKLGDKFRAQFYGTVKIPPPDLCTDNAVMIATAGFFSEPISNSLDLQANPNLSLQ